MKRFFTLILFVLSLMSCSSNNAEATNSSVAEGSIINGLRVYSDADIKTGKITAYRGDYVNISTESGSETFVIDSLDISHTFKKNELEKSYFKLKKVGEYSYTYGDVKGLITIKEYDQPNYKAISSKEAVEVIKNVNPLILDVRTPGEFKNAHIENAVLIPVQVIQSEYVKIEDYKDKPVLIYCASGNRSTVAARVLIDNGFKQVYNLKRGIGEWHREGYKVVK